MMTFSSIGDLTRHFQSSLQTRQLKQDMSNLQQALTTGKTPDLARALGGDMSALAGIEHSNRRLDGFGVALAETEVLIGSVQTALGVVQDQADTIGAVLLQAAASGQATLVDTAAGDAKARLSQVVSALNTTVAGQSIFAGTATQGAALAEAETILTALMSEIAGETTASGVIAAVDDWMARPDGFAAIAYLGSDTPLVPVQVGEHAHASHATTANDPVLRDVIGSLALAALVDAGALDTRHGERVALLSSAAERMVSAGSGVAGLRAEVGIEEARLAETRVAQGAERTALGLARQSLTGIDPYETATALQDAQARLDTLFAITARLSRLSLAEYLR